MISVLYVDDEPSLLEIGKLFLERNGQFTVDTISSAPAALTLLHTKNYDAIISDFQMPDMDGIEFLKQVRTSGNTIPFILFTGRGREEVVIQALNEGADFYLQKGGDPMPQFTELAHQIRQAVQQRRAEISIMDHERREADIISFLPDATFAIDTNGVVIAWNTAAEKMTGVRASEILGKGNYEYTLPFYHERRPALIDLVLHDDPAVEAKYPLLKKDGRTLVAEATIPFLYNGRGATIWFTATPLFNIHGTITGAIESVRDITGRKRAEMELSRKHEELEAAYNQLITQEIALKQQMNDIIASQAALRESEERFRAIFNATFQFISLIKPDGTVIEVNQTAMDFTGETPDQTIGKPFWEVRGWRGNDKSVLELKHAIVRAAGGEFVRYEVVLQGKGGTRGFFDFSIKPVFDRDGAVILLIPEAHNITGQKTIENSLRTSQIMLEEAMDLALMANWEFDDRTDMFTFNDRFFALYGTTAEREGGYQMPMDVYFREFVHPADRDRITVAVKRAREMSDPQNVSELEHRIIRRDGEIRHIVVRVQRITDNDNHVMKIHGVNQDITGRKVPDGERIIR